MVLPASLGRSPRWDRAVEAVSRQPPPGPQCFIHRDYHPANIPWLEGRLTGVVDWTQGLWGPPSVDLGHMRWNLAAEYGPEVATRFLERYGVQASTAFDHDPYWDVVTLIDLVADVDPPSPPSRPEIARLERYLIGVLADL